MVSRYVAKVMNLEKLKQLTNWNGRNFVIFWKSILRCGTHDLFHAPFPPFYSFPGGSLPSGAPFCHCHTKGLCGKASSQLRLL